MWKKLGLIYAVDKRDWRMSHAQNPFVEDLGGGNFRVHFACRDGANRARGGFFEFNIGWPDRIAGVSGSPSLDFGLLGAFDDSGVMPSAIIREGKEKYLYYTGWSKTVDVPFAFHIGMAVSEDDGKTYRRSSSAPVLGRNSHDPYITGAPWVLKEDGKFKMWYISGTRWEKESSQAKPKHYYTVKYADSDDGIRWRTSDHLCIPYGPGEYAIARPIVFREDDRYRMWFTFRGGANTYRVGTAFSKDGINWHRDPDPLGIAVSPGSWDSQMICYACPVFHKGRQYALYNGNNYGETGVGLAVEEG